MQYMKYLSNNYIRRKHVRSDTPEYKAWHNMIYRCYSPKCKSYKHYGARGITVCQKWQDSFQAFFDDVGPKPSTKHSIHRIDNYGNYEPSNCTWATAKEQAFNNRKNQNARINNVWFKPSKETIIKTKYELRELAKLAKLAKQQRPIKLRELAKQQRAIKVRERAERIQSIKYERATRYKKVLEIWHVERNWKAICQM